MRGEPAKGGEPTPEFKRAVLVFAVVDAVLILAGTAAYIVTDQIYWLIGCAVVAGVIGVVLMSRAKRAGATGGTGAKSRQTSIVEGGGDR